MNKTLNGVTGYEYAFGTCVECGEEVTQSCYWRGPWLIPMYFVPEHNQPLCSATCSNKNYGEKDAG